MDGVVRPPSLFSMTLALFPSITATQELVVPRSMPIAFAMTGLLVRCSEIRVNDFRSIGRRRPSRERSVASDFFDHVRDAESALGGETANASRDRLGALKRLVWCLAWPLP